jgi:hypothetical protein
VKKILYFSFFVFLFQGIDLSAGRSGTLKFSHSTNKELDIKNIDSQIQSYEDLKEHYLSKAARRRSRGDRLELSPQENGKIAAQKEWKSADEYDRMADQIQDRIDTLEEERSGVEKRAPY